MSEPTQVHLVTLVVVDTDGLGADEVRALLERAKHVCPSVLEIRTAEVDWSDDHPLNKVEGWERAVADLFPAPPVPQIQHPPASADSQQQGDDGEDGLDEV